MGKSSFLQEFKAFAMKGNVVDMAVGVIIGGAFGKIVSLKSVCSLIAMARFMKTRYFAKPMR